MNKRWLWLIICTFVLIVIASLLFPLLNPDWHWMTRQRYASPTPVFTGQSIDLYQTAIVPTLDSPIPAGKNAIWCATFPMAWRQAQNTVFHAPILVDGAKQVAQRLNTAPLDDINLIPADSYVNAGRIEDGIIAKIRQEMTQKFPAVPAASLPMPATGPGIEAYAYLNVHLKFTQPFCDLGTNHLFLDDAQHDTTIKSFGITKELRELDPVRQQVQVLYYDRDTHKVIVASGSKYTHYIVDCAVDLCATSQPYRIILASLPKPTSLADAVVKVEKHIAAAAEQPEEIEARGPLRGTDRLVVPEMCWRLTHHFAELEGKPVRNAGGMPIVLASQEIDFTLDRTGAQVTSDSDLHLQASPKYLEFTHPFLLLLTRRGSNAPFFAMWVDNAELLDK